MPEKEKEKDPQQEIKEETNLLLDDSHPYSELRLRKVTARVRKKIHLYKCRKGLIDVFKSRWLVAESARETVREMEIHLYKCGKGLIDAFKSNLGGWEQDQLEVRTILEKYRLKSIFAFNVYKCRFELFSRNMVIYHPK
ncbi:unnamed protein product [Microthlaspi erraticum]|uniref:Uncharacterized protein n=1 Tax=Microthlaspi erraticum TaxID=1685480 RepID=A0A6D2IBX1_9BRAS|nr:unnamed protein product [Microthlaspi erraticum]